MGRSIGAARTVTARACSGRVARLRGVVRVDCRTLMTKPAVPFNTPPAVIVVFHMAEPAMAVIGCIPETGMGHRRIGGVTGDAFRLGMAGCTAFAVRIRKLGMPAQPETGCMAPGGLA